MFSNYLIILDLIVQNYLLKQIERRRNSKKNLSNNFEYFVIFPGGNWLPKFGVLKIIIYYY